MANILVIGGGVAGLSAGIYAQLCGHRATVCERHFAAGGNLTGWNRAGYHIDNCIHWLTGTNKSTSTYKMWEDLGALGGVDIRKENSLYTYELCGERMSLYRDIDKFERRMLEISPEDEREIRSFVRAIRVVQGLMGVGGKEHNKSVKLLELIRSVPSLVRYYKMTAGDFAKRLKSPLLREFFVSFMTDRFGILALIFVFAHFCGDNADLPAGGSVSMAKRMVERFKSLGGKLLLKKEAIKIHRKGKRAESVEFSDGEVIDADYVVLTTDPAAAFGTLLDEKMPVQLEKMYSSERYMRFSSYQCAFACDLPTLPFEADITVKLPERYRVRMGSEYLVVREFSHEPSYAPEGKNIIQTMTFTDERTARKFIDRYDSKEHYESYKRYLARIVKEAVEECLPELCGHIELLDMWTPATYKRYVGSDIGSYMSFAFSSRVLPIKKSNRIRGLDNVIMATQWLQSPGGLPIAAEVGRSAIYTINKLCK